MIKALTAVTFTRYGETASTRLEFGGDDSFIILLQRDQTKEAISRYLHNLADTIFKQED